MAETFEVMQEYIEKGLLGGISLSEVSAETIHQAVKILGKKGVVCVEVELSLFAAEVLENGVAAACKEYGIPLVAYSPLGRGVSSCFSFFFSLRLRDQEGEGWRADYDAYRS